MGNITTHDLNLELTKSQFLLLQGRDLVCVKFKSHPHLLTLKYKNQYLIAHKTRKEMLEILEAISVLLNDVNINRLLGARMEVIQ